MWIVVFFIFGLITGSFLNVCIYRLPRGMSIVHPPSRCTECGASVGVSDNIPVISYILLRGKCRHCGARISPRYPLVELLNALSYVLVFSRFGMSSLLPLIAFCIFVSSLIVIFFIDLEHQIIPNVITLPGIVLAALLGSTVLPDVFSRGEPLGWKNSLLGILAGGGSFYLIAFIGRLLFRKEAMGGGDIKMMAMAGGVLGWQGVLLTTFLASLSGSVIGLFLILMKGREWGSRIPFGPYLALGAFISLVWGYDIVGWYLHAE